MKRSHILASVVIAFGAAGSLFAQEQDQPHLFTGHPGSSLAKYEEAVANLEKLEDDREASDSQRRSAAVEILKKFYGFNEVQFASGFKREIETGTAVFMARHLKDILPADFSNQSYIRPDHLNIYSDDPKEQWRLEPVNTKKVFVLRFDRDVHGIELKAKVTDGNLVEDPFQKGRKVPERIETYTLIVGGKRFLTHTGNLKAWMSMLINYEDLYYLVDYDIKK